MHHDGELVLIKSFWIVITNFSNHRTQFLCALSKGGGFLFVPFCQGSMIMLLD